MLFGEVPGLEKEKALLRKSVADNRVAHAQIFYGRTGGSAYQLALAFASYLLCEDRRVEDSCGHCAACRQMKQNGHPDVHFIFPLPAAQIDGAYPLSSAFRSQWTNFLAQKRPFQLSDWQQFIDLAHKEVIISVRQSAEIARLLSLKSYGGGYRVVLIWLPERLHLAAANKLLKAIEEPEAKSILLFVSEDLEQVLPTITSRCQKLNVPLPRAEDLKAWLIQQGVEAEKAYAVAQIAEGNPTEALHLSANDNFYRTYAAFWRDWLRACYSAQVESIFELSDQFGSWGKGDQKESLRFLARSLELAFSHYQRGARLDHPLFNEAGFDLNRFAPYIHLGNAPSLVQIIDLALRDLRRNGNPKMVFADTSFQFSRALRSKT